MKGIIMMRAKYLLIIMAVLSAAILFTSCQNEPTSVEPEEATQQGLSKFTLPDGATFVSATFYIYVIEPTSQNIDVHQITNPWEEMVVTWNNFGGSYAPGVEGSFNASTIGWNYVDVTVLVGNWLDGTNDNYGLLLDQVDKTFPRTRYWSRDWFENQPYLEIFYTVNGGPVVSDTTTAIGDAYIYELNPDQNTGDFTTLYTGWGYATDLEKQALVMFDIEATPQVDCEDCDGKVTELTLQYNGSEPAQVTVEQKKNHEIIFDSFLQPGDQFTVVGTDNGTLGTEIKLFVDGQENTKIHTSCSRPIGPGLVSGNFEVISGYSKNGGLLCPIPPQPDCGDCDGKVTQLTLKYNGSGTPWVEVKQKKHNEIVFEGYVASGAEFTFVGTDKGTLGTEIKIYVDGNENAKIHTSCSKPIGPGLIKGDFEVMEGYSKKGGKLCPLPPQPDCGDCDGKVTRLILQYDGTDAAQVKVEQKKNHDVVFDEWVEPGEQFQIFGTDKGTLGTEIKIYVDGDENAKIHTSCSKPIGPGLVKGDFQVIEGYSKNGGKLCPIPPPPPPGSDWCDGAKAQALLVEYTGEDCILNHNQDPSKVFCDGDPLFAATVRILAQDKANPDDPNAKIWFDGLVNLNGQFLIDADFNNLGETKLKAETHVFIYTSDGLTLLQTLEFHTSCSQPLGEGNQFGSLLMVDFIPE